MEEKKTKRFRPSLRAYRALEDEVSALRERLRLQCRDCSAEEALEEQIDGTGGILRDCYAWRRKYRALIEENRRLKEETERLRRRGLLARLLNRE